MSQYYDRAKDFNTSAIMDKLNSDDGAQYVVNETAKGICYYSYLKTLLT